MALTLSKIRISKPQFAGKEIPYKVGRVLTIDPGLGGTGWASWEASSWEKLCKPVASGAIEVASCDLKRDWWWRMDWLCDQMMGVVFQEKTNAYFIEQPQYMPGGVGITAAERGDLIKLAMLAGGICSRISYNHASTPWFPVPVSEWKGQLAKDICADRASRKLNMSFKGKTTHEADAIALGLYCKGFFG